MGMDVVSPACAGVPSGWVPAPAPAGQVESPFWMVCAAHEQRKRVWGSEPEVGQAAVLAHPSEVARHLVLDTQGPDMEILTCVKVEGSCYFRHCDMALYLGSASNLFSYINNVNSL